LDQARLLLAEHAALNTLAQDLKDGREPLLQLAVDSIIPITWLSPALAKLTARFPGTRVQLCQFHAPWHGHADLILTQEIRANEPVSLLGTLQLVPVVHSEHPLAQVTAPLTQHDLSAYPAIEITPAPAAPLQNLHWRFVRSDLAVAMIRQRLVYGWLPLDEVQGFIDSGEFKVLPLGEDGRRLIPIYSYSTNTRPGPALAVLRALLLEVSQNRAGSNAG
jgi:DNA-binding transcriptional LysR family regulator